MVFLKIVSRSRYLVGWLENVVSRRRFKSRSTCNTKKRVRPDSSAYFVLAGPNRIICKFFLESVNIWPKELQAFRSSSQLKARWISWIVSWSRDYFIFVVYLIWLEICFNTTVVVKAWLVTKTVSRYKHALRLLVHKLVWVVWAGTHRRLGHYLFEWLP